MEVLALITSPSPGVGNRHRHTTECPFLVSRFATLHRPHQSTRFNLILGVFLAVNRQLIQVWYIVDKTEQWTRLSLDRQPRII